MKIKIENNKKCFVQLWRELELTRQRFENEYRRFCVRRVMRTWYGPEATDDFIWEVCYRGELLGYDLLTPPTEDISQCRTFLKALVAVTLGIRVNDVNAKAMNDAYKEVFGAVDIES